VLGQESVKVTRRKCGLLFNNKELRGKVKSTPMNKSKRIEFKGQSQKREREAEARVEPVSVTSSLNKNTPHSLPSVAVALLHLEV
jgi:hypothetical protein